MVESDVSRANAFGRRDMAEIIKLPGLILRSTIQLPETLGDGRKQEED